MINDGIGDDADADDDNDSVNDLLDAFPLDPAASVDTDGDGMPDEFNAGATPEQIAASPLVLDLDDDNDGVSDADELVQGRNPKLNEAAALMPLLNVILD